MMSLTALFIFYSLSGASSVWRSSNVLVSINEVNLRWAHLVLGWVTVRVRLPERHLILVC